MKSMRIALAILAMVILAGAGFALLNSSPRRPAPPPPADETPRPRPLATKPAPSVPRPPAPRDAEAIARPTQALPVLAAPKLEVPGLDRSKEEAEVKRLEAAIAERSGAGKIGEANTLRRDLIRTRARLGEMGAAAPIYLEIARAELNAGNAQAAADAASSAMVMASVGRKDPTVLDDVAMVQAAAAILRGDLAKADGHLKEARTWRNSKGGEAGNPSAEAELSALEALLDDAKGHYSSADEALDAAVDPLVIGAGEPAGAAALARSRWVFGQSLAIREAKLGADAEETRRARARLEKLGPTAGS